MKLYFSLKIVNKFQHATIAAHFIRCGAAIVIFSFFQKKLLQHYPTTVNIFAICYLNQVDSFCQVI